MATYYLKESTSAPTDEELRRALAEALEAIAPGPGSGFAPATTERAPGAPGRPARPGPA
jgi:hypothetical protein